MDSDDLRKRIMTLDGLVVADREKTMCSFCKGKRKVVARSNLSGGSICEQCLYIAKEQLGFFPPGAVVCSGCQKWDRFILHYKSPVGTAAFCVLCSDDKGQPVYTVESTNFAWYMGIKPAKAKCGNCYAKLGAWVLNKNDYVKRLHAKQNR